MKQLQKIYFGARSMIRGIKKTAFSTELHKSYFLLLLVLFLLVLACTASGLFAVFQWLPIDEQAQGWQRWGTWPLRIFTSIVVLLFAPAVCLLVMNLCVPIFAEIPFLAGMKMLRPELAQELQQSAGLGLLSSIKNSSRRLFSYLLYSLPLVAIGIIPVFGPLIAAAGHLLNAARTLGWELLDPYFDRRQIPWKTQKELMTALRYERLGIGLVAAPLLAMPLLGIALFGVLQAAAAQSACEFLEDEIKAKSSPRKDIDPSNNH